MKGGRLSGLGTSLFRDAKGLGRGGPPAVRLSKDSKWVSLKEGCAYCRKETGKEEAEGTGTGYRDLAIAVHRSGTGRQEGKWLANVLDLL